MSEIAISVTVTNNEKTGLKQWENECFHNVIVGGKKMSTALKASTGLVFFHVKLPNRPFSTCPFTQNNYSQNHSFSLCSQPNSTDSSVLPSSLSGMDQTFRAKCSQCLQNWVFVLDFTLSFSPIVLSVHQFGMKTSAQQHIKYYLTASSDHLL